MRTDMRIQTPWGLSDDGGMFVADGITWYSTPSHGGYHVTGAALDAIPLELRRTMRAWRRAADDDPWFEEDCEWCAVVIAHPWIIPEPDRARELAKARRTLAGQKRNNEERGR